jgi:hypothetical protein
MSKAGIDSMGIDISDTQISVLYMGQTRNQTFKEYNIIYFKKSIGRGGSG